MANRKIAAVCWLALFHFLSSVRLLFLPALHFFDDEAARLLDGLARVVDHHRPECHHQRRRSALAVTLVANGKIFLQSVRRATLGTFVNTGIEVKFEICFWKNIGADVAAFHHQIAELNALTLLVLHPLAHFRISRDVRRGGSHLLSSNFFVWKISIDQQMNFAIGIFESGFPFPAERVHRFGMVYIHFLLQTMPGQRAIHRASIDVNIAEHLGHLSGIGAFAAGARAVDGNDDGLIHSFLTRTRNPNLNPQREHELRFRAGL